MGANQYTVMVLALVPALLVLTVHGFPSQARVYREAGDMANMQSPQESNSSIARPILSGIETLARFTVCLHDIVLAHLFFVCFLYTYLFS